MIHFPILRWGEPYDSLEKDKVYHFATGELMAEVSLANGGLIERDMRHAERARAVLREIPCKQLLAMCSQAADLFLNAELPLGDGTQTTDEFVRQQSSTTGLPEHMCRFNMEKLNFVLKNLEAILTSLMRGLPFDILTRGHGDETFAFGDGESKTVLRSYQACTPVLGMVLPSNSPGVHGLWLPIIPLQIGLVLKPGPQEPWTPWRMSQAFFQAGIPKQAIAIYPGLGDVGAAVLAHCPRSLIFGGTATVERYHGNPAVQVHGPGFSKILLGDDEVDNWEKYLDLMINSVLVNSGRGCINCSGIWASRHTEEIADALARRFAAVPVLPPDDPAAAIAAFTVKGQAEAINSDIESCVDEAGTYDATARHRDGPRWVAQERCDYLLPTVLHSASPDLQAPKKEYMFPFVTVVKCPQNEMLSKIGGTLVCSGITHDETFRKQLIDARNIDRLNLGALPTIQLNWFQPHEGSIVDFLFRGRALQLG